MLSLFDTGEGITAGFAYQNFDEISIYNKNGWLEHFPANDVKFVGAICRVERDCNSKIC